MASRRYSSDQEDGRRWRERAAALALPSASTRDVGEGLPKRFRNRSATPAEEVAPLDGSSESGSARSCVELNFAPLSQLRNRPTWWKPSSDRWNGRDDIPAVDKAVGCRPERSVVIGDEFRPADARRAEDEDLSTSRDPFRVVPDPPSPMRSPRRDYDPSRTAGGFSSMHRSMAAPTSGQTASAAS